MTKGEEETELREWIFAGKRYDVESKQTQYLYADMAGGLEIRCFSEPLPSKYRQKAINIGGVYEVTVIMGEEGRCTVHQPVEWSRTWRQDPNQVIRWRAEEIASLEVLRRIREEKAGRKENPLYGALDELRRAYKITNTAGRQAILASIIEYVTRK